MEKVKPYKFVPQFRPMNIQVFIDGGVEKMSGYLEAKQIVEIEYEADCMRIICSK